MTPAIVFRPVASRVYAAVAWAVAAVVVGALLRDGGVAGLVRFGAFPLLLAGFAWAVLWWPSVRLDDDGVEVANVSRTVRVPWSAITGVETRWGLRLLTTSGKVDAWAAPARGALGRVRDSRAGRPRPAPRTTAARADEPLRLAGDAVTVAEVIEDRLADRGTTNAVAPGTGHHRVNVVQLLALLVPAGLVVVSLVV